MFLLLASFAHAQSADEPVPLQDDVRVVYKKSTEIDFESVNVGGVAQKPTGIIVLERKRASFNPLIELRVQFNEEMSASVAEVR